ncbi:hypothetical protein [Saccharothrix violaceirubra]|uniref:Uncharacterized protein n=1 Tax=Saccharothrix violaceirubra TaxID=413306 RepID=A0A7W7T4D6_9PSEU|nr:hypothetical protein [Saccharothrix violaceirubra]MBB4966353.1 hypothetical protein [Saccharothrix violaceirubra]
MVAALVLVGVTPARAQAADRAFTAVSPAPDFVLPSIVVQYDPARSTGIDWRTTTSIPVTEYQTDRSKARDAVVFVQEAVTKMTGRTLTVKNSADLSRGIVFTTIAGATPDIRDDPAVIQALAGGGPDAKEAYYLRSTPERLLLVANTYDGLASAAAKLMETVGYEVLGMGPNWVFAPTAPTLVFDVEQSGRPGFHTRQLTAMSGQYYGVGTIVNAPLADPADENVERGYRRWQTGALMRGQSAPSFPGHSLQAYHKAVAQDIRDSGNPAGFLAPTHLGTDAARQALPPADAKDHLWITSDGPLQAYVSNGTAWVLQTLGSGSLALDLSVRTVRERVLREVRTWAENVHFKSRPDDPAILAIEREDGGRPDAVFNANTRDRAWYPEYLSAEGVPFGAPWALHGFKGLNQPREIWDSASQSDTVYGFANWLLREYDKWLDAQPPGDRVTSTGKSKKSLLRASFYSYNYHDVPPHFNLDPRIRVAIAGYTKHRGVGEWRSIVTHLDIGQAMARLLPAEPPADYRIYSVAHATDWGMANLPARHDLSAAAIADDISAYHRGGFRTFLAETDLNFGKFGLGYYLMAKMLWNPTLTAAQLDAVRTRWLQRAFGRGWAKVKEFVDFMLLPNFPVNTPYSWGRAVELVDAADRLVDPVAEPGPDRRLDDLKQFFYYYFLQDSGRMTTDAPETREFMWKGQMSYMNALMVPLSKVYGRTDPAAVAGPQTAAGPAHYTAAETAAWWNQVKAYWPVRAVNRFEDATLADGTPAAWVDRNDVGPAAEFVTPGAPAARFLYNSATSGHTPRFLTSAEPGVHIGFQLLWQKYDNGTTQYASRDVRYGIERWSATTKSWISLRDMAQPGVTPTELASCPQFVNRVCLLATVSIPASSHDVHRFTVGSGGDYAYLYPLTFNVATNQSTGRSAHTYTGPGAGLTQAPSYFYIPKGTTSLDLEVWDRYGGKTLRLYSGLLSKNPQAAFRDVDISAYGTNSVPLRPEEGGTIARISASGFAFPYLHSVPRLWAMSPNELVVPCAIAKADGLTVPPGRCDP